QLLTLLVFLAEVAILTALTQASLGQKLVRLKVVDAETGGFVPPLRILLRTILIVLVLPVLFTKEGRGYHDVLAQTIVVKA
ncbi:MAG: RDD family protein, partial [Actinomycetes bacterium]